MVQVRYPVFIDPYSRSKMVWITKTVPSIQSIEEATSPSKPSKPPSATSLFDLIDDHWQEDCLKRLKQAKADQAKGRTAQNREFSYEGQKKGSLREGFGIQRYADGSVYEGEFKQNKFSGRGTLTRANGDCYEGSIG